MRKSVGPGWQKDKADRLRSETASILQIYADLKIIVRHDPTASGRNMKLRIPCFLRLRILLRNIQVD